MTIRGLARKVLASLYADEGYCPLCRKRVGNTLACNDKYHADHCVIHDLRKEAKNG